MMQRIRKAPEWPAMSKITGVTARLVTTLAVAFFLQSPVAWATGGREHRSDVVRVGGAPSAATVQGVISVPVMYGAGDTNADGWSHGEIRPGSIYFGAGGDRNITHLAWSQWNVKSAYGEGKLYQRSCWGRCLTGTITVVNVTLQQPRTRDGARYFTRMTIWRDSLARATVYSYRTYGAGTVPFWH